LLQSQKEAVAEQLVKSNAGRQQWGRKEACENLGFPKSKPSSLVRTVVDISRLKSQDEGKGGE
jgi:hypothetical protein